MQTLPAPRELVLEQLERMLASDTFAGAERSRVLLRFLVEHVVENQSDRLKEYTIGSEALGRGDTFDPRTDPIVRAEASRLRSRIERYYATNGATDTVLITLPKGSYVPQVQSRAIPEAAPLASAARSTPSRLQRFIWFVLGGATVGAAVALFVWVRGHEAPPAEFREVDIPLSAADRSLGSDLGNDVIISPDGTRIVFVARGADHVVRLMTHTFGQLTADGLPVVVGLRDTDGGRAPFFSRDGRRVGFWAGDKLKTIPVDGGSPVELTQAIDFCGGSWVDDDSIIVCLGHALIKVSEKSGESTVLADLTNEGVAPRWPQVVPGGHVLFSATGPQGPDASTIEVLSLSDRKRRPLLRGGTFGRYLGDGFLLYVNQGTLFAVPFDLQRLAPPPGRGIPVLERVAYSGIFGFAQFDVSQDGKLVFRRSPGLVASWIDRTGKIDPLLKKPGAYTFPRLSLDGQRLAINVTDSGVIRTDVYDLRQPEQNTRLPFAPGSMSAAWSPDGFLVVGGLTGMSWMRVDDVSKLETLTATPNVQIPWSFNFDGTRLAYCAGGPQGLDLWTIPVSHSAARLTAGKPEPFLQTPYVECAPSFSPDGRWLAYGWGPKGIWEVYVQPFPPDRSKEKKVSQGGGRIARWLPNGREFVYRTDDHRVMVVGYEVKNGEFIAGTPKEWTSVRLADTGVIPNFDVDPKGDRILGLLPASREENERLRKQITVMPRFRDEVRRRLSLDRK